MEASITRFHSIAGWNLLLDFVLDILEAETAQINSHRSPVVELDTPQLSAALEAGNAGEIG